MNEKAVVITGAGSGIGRGIAQHLGKKGILVFCTDIDGGKVNKTRDSIIEKGGKAFSFQLDVTSSEELDKLDKFLIENFGYINYWINCAGISYILPFEEHTEEIWNQTIDINLKGQFLSSKIAVKHMLANGEGSIINISSQSGKVGTDSYQAYCSSKFGVIGLTQSLAKEFGPNRIRVNSIAPGVIYTPMWEQQYVDYASKKNIEPGNVMNYFCSKIPLRRLGTLEDIAELSEFLLSDKSSYITGQTINLNGGDIMF